MFRKIHYEIDQARNRRNENYQDGIYQSQLCFLASKVAVGAPAIEVAEVLTYTTKIGCEYREEGFSMAIAFIQGKGGEGGT